MDGRAQWGNVVTGARRWWVPGVVALAMAALVFVPRALASVGTDTERLADGATVEFGGSRITVGSGWEMSRTSTDLHQRVVLRRGDVVVQASVVEFRTHPTLEEAWDGFERLLTARGADVGAAAPFSTIDGDKGLAAPLAAGDRAGTAFLVPAADGTSAVEGTTIGPGSDEADQVAALEAVATIAAPAGGE